EAVADGIESLNLLLPAGKKATFGGRWPFGKDHRSLENQFQREFNRPRSPQGVHAGTKSKAQEVPVTAVHERAGGAVRRAHRSVENRTERNCRSGEVREVEHVEDGHTGPQFDSLLHFVSPVDA